MAGVAFGATVGRLSDGNPLARADAYDVTIDWGDGSSSVARVAGDGRGGFDLIGSHVYATAGERVLRLSASDREGAQAGASGLARVGISDFAIEATGIDIEARIATPFTGTVARFTDADAAGSVGDFEARIDWGDGVEISGEVVAAAIGFEVRGQHVYDTRGSYPLRVRIADIGGSSVRRRRAPKWLVRRTARRWPATTASSPSRTPRWPSTCARTIATPTSMP